MKINSKDFRDLSSYKPVKGTMYLNFPNSSIKTRRVHVCADAVHFFENLGVKRIKPLVSNDNKLIVLVDAGEDGIKLDANSVGLSHNYILDLIKSIAGKEGVRFIGTPDAKEKNIVFDLTKPVFY